MKPFIELQTSTSVLRPQLVRHREPRSVSLEHVQVSEWFEPSFYLRLSEIIPGICPEALLFALGPGARTRIHTDVRHGDTPDPNIWAMNFIWNTDNNVMLWFDPLVTRDELSVTEANTLYVDFEDHEVRMTAACFNPQTAILVRKDIPHQAINLSDHCIRYCLSVRGELPVNDWPSIVEFFRVHNL